ncbi:MAG: DUF3817 domain-containing protein [Planctomycetes bacterium]|nr:DUF3817 domain-containing protein [Planctomycetota bacterium]
MNFLNASRDSQWRRIKWHTVFAFLLAISVVVLFLGWLFHVADLPQYAKVFDSIHIFFFAFAMVVLAFAILALLGEIFRVSRESVAKLDNLAEIQVRHNNLLTQITQAAHLSDTAKEIVFREMEQMQLGEAALNKLHQHDFDAAGMMIDAMEQSPRYKDLGAKLRRMAEKYRTATEDGRVLQIITHIENLMDQARWAQAALQIDNLIKMFPYSDKAKMMPSRLRERKDIRKGELLCEWDKAVLAKDTDQSLELLKELDQYLTPAEAVALQESASTVFRTKLHNLGVQFSMAVTERKWKDALETGRQIVQAFPNSRMAAEIRSRLDILQEHAHKQQEQKIVQK